MKLLLEDVLESEEIYQDITVNEDSDVVAVRPHVYIHSGAVAGNLTVRIDDENGNEVATSSAVAINDIRDSFSSVNDYAHGYYKFDISARLYSGTNYRLVVANSSYTFSESAYAGLCRDFDLRKVTADWSPSLGMNSAYDFEVWIKRKV